MLLLDSRSALIDGVSVFPDHVDALQWYYLPTTPHLTVVDGTPSFQLVGFRGDEEGGLLSFDCNIGLDDAQLRALEGKIRSQFDLDGDVNLAPVPLVDGTVRLITMGTDTGAPPPADGEPAPEQRFDVKALHSDKPSLYAENQASFSVFLDKDSFAIVEATLESTIMPIAVIYSLDFLGLRPAYQVTLSIDWDRVQKHLDDSFSSKLWIFSSDISKVVDELDESKAIDLRADTFVEEGTEGVIDRRDAALAQVRAMITTAFFEPSIPPWTPQQPKDWEKALRLVAELGTQAAALAAGGPAGAALGGQVAFSYKHTDYTRIDKKHLDVNFSERTTVRRSIYPQGHLASLFAPIAASPELKQRLVLLVSPSDFFKRRKVKAQYRPNTGLRLIDSIEVRADYGGDARNALLTPDTWSADFEWLSDLQNGVMVRDVDLSYEVRFKDVDTSERPGTLTAAQATVKDDLVSLKPETDLFAIRSVPVLAERVPWTRFDSVEVHLRHRDEASGIDERELFRLTEKVPTALWEMMLIDRDRTSYEVRTVMRAHDGNDVDSGWAVSDDEQVRASNPFREHQVTVFPRLSWDEIREVFVDLRYEDPANDVLVEETLHLSKDSGPQRFVVDLRDPTHKAVEYTVIFSYLDGRLVQLPPSVTYERQIIADPTSRGHRVVEVVAPADWLARKVERATVELRFEDFTEGLSYASQLELDGPDARARFEFDYADVTRNRYEWRSTVLFENGLQQSTDWTASAEPTLVLRLP